MAYIPTESRLGVTAFTNIDTTTAVPFGTIIRGADTASGKGGGEFIYLPGNTKVAAAGLFVTYDPSTSGGPISTVTTSATANQGKPVALSMSACNTIAKFGWFQVRGVGVALKAAAIAAKGVKVYLSSTSGRITPTAASGKQVLGAVTVGSATSTVSTVNVLLQAPFLQGATL